MCALLCHAGGLHVLHKDPPDGCHHADAPQGAKDTDAGHTNTDTVLNHIQMEHVALVTTHNDDLLSERQWAQVAHMVMTQYGYKVAMRKFGKEADRAVTKELAQMH